MPLFATARPTLPSVAKCRCACWSEPRWHYLKRKVFKVKPSKSFEVQGVCIGRDYAIDAIKISIPCRGLSTCEQNWQPVVHVRGVSQVTAIRFAARARSGHVRTHLGGETRAMHGLIVANINFDLEFSIIISYVNAKAEVKLENATPFLVLPLHMD